MLVLGLKLGNRRLGFIAAECKKRSVLRVKIPVFSTSTPQDHISKWE